jgi:hypothetical protein
MAMIRNPNAPATAEGDVPAGKRAAVAAQLQGLIAGWPATDEAGVPLTHITVHDLVARLRQPATLAALGLSAEQVTAPRVRALLRQLGHEPD